MRTREQGAITLPRTNAWAKKSFPIVVVALWFGLVTGLVEGVGFLIAQQFNRLTGVWIEIVWISPVVYGCLFALGGVILSILLSYVKPPYALVSSCFLFSLAAFSTWLAVAFAQSVNAVALFILAIGLACTFTRWLRNNEQTFINVTTRSLPWIVLATALVFIAIEGGGRLRERIAVNNLPASPANAPNVLVIVIDALRADHLSSYGYARETSLNIDRLAEQGVLFENAFSPASYTLPSHASLLSGLYQSQHGVQWLTFDRYGRSEYPTLPGFLQARGYRTAAFSANTFWFTREQGYGRGFMRFEDYFHSPADMVLRTAIGTVAERLILRHIGFEDIPARKHASDINHSLLSWITLDPAVPFFAFLNYMDVHDPYLPPQPFRGKFSTEEAPGGLLNWRLGREDIELTPDQLESEIAAYDGAIAYVDSQIGQLLQEIENIGLDNNLLVVITSDHGEAFGEHGTMLHAKSLYLEETHVPFIIWYPEYAPAGKRISRPISTTALPATVADLVAPESAAAVFPSPSVRELWVNPEARSNWPFPLGEMEQRPWVPDDYKLKHGSMRSVISPKWHYIEHDSLGSELYDWRSDDEEKQNLAYSLTLDSVKNQFQGSLRMLLKGSDLHARVVSGGSIIETKTD